MLTVFSFKWGSKYSPDYVNILDSMLKRNLSNFRHICITDDDKDVNVECWPLWSFYNGIGCYRRLYVFSEEFGERAGGKFVCIDLDCIITSNIDELFTDDDFRINASPGMPTHYNAAMFMLQPGTRKQVYENFKGPVKSRFTGTDQAFIRETLPNEKVWKEEIGHYGITDITDKKIVFFSGPNKDPKTCKHPIREYWY